MKIDLHHEILAWRGEVARQGLLAPSKKLAMVLLGLVFRFAWLYRVAGWLMRRVVPLLPRWLVYTRWNAWGRGRELPPMPAHSFKALYRRHRGEPR